MDERQVNIVRAQLLQTFLQAGDEFVFAQVLDPDFGSDEQLITRHAAFGDSLTHRGFVVIDLRGVDSTIAQLQRGFYGCDNNIIFQTEGAKTKCRDCHDFPRYFFISVNG